MRLNKYVAENTLLSRRKADVAIQEGRVLVNDKPPELGQVVTANDQVKLDGRKVTQKTSQSVTLLLNKPVGYVCSKNGQGARTIYSLLPKQYLHLNIAGRLDKDSSGLVVLTNNGDLLQELSHPSNKKQKIYEVTLAKPLNPTDIDLILKGIDIGDPTPSQFKAVQHLDGTTYQVVLEEGRNRQIRRTFKAINHDVTSLNRLKLGDFSVSAIEPGKFIVIVP